MLVIQIVPYSEIQGLSSIGRIRKRLNITKQGKIVLLQGRLKREEEAELIKTTMEEINKDFKGIELAVIYPKTRSSAMVFEKLKQNLANMLLGDQQGLTIIGPASIVKEIKKDPDKIQLFTKNTRAQKRKRKRYNATPMRQMRHIL